MVVISMATSSPARQSRVRVRLDGLQAGRALAALAVAAFHANVYVLPDKLYEGGKSWSAFSMGYAGVEYFFVLSGFIMVLVHRQDFGVPEKAGAFLWRRIVRIYPIYWIVLLGLVMASQIAPGLGSEALRDLRQFLISALLLPTTGPSALDVSWTLTHEMIFYLVFMVLVWHLKAGIALAIVWAVGCVAATLGANWPFPFDTIFSPYNLLFPLGMISALLWRRAGKSSARALLLVGLALFLTVGLLEALGGVEWHKPLRTLTYGLGASAMVIGLAAGAVKVPKSLSLLGDASYAIYLIHVPVMAVLARVFAQVGLHSAMPRVAVLLALVASAAIAGLLLHLVVERPLLEQLRRRAQRALNTSDDGLDNPSSKSA